MSYQKIIDTFKVRLADGSLTQLEIDWLNGELLRSWFTYMGTLPQS